MSSPEQTRPVRGRGYVEALASLSRAAPPLRGKVNLANRLMRRAEGRDELNGSWQTRLKDGTRLELPRQSRMSWAVAFQGLYDVAAVRHVSQFIRADTLVLDVGASLGLWTVQLGKIAAARGAELWTFEPNPANTAWIKRNVELNGLSSIVTVHEVGLGDKSESATLVSAEYGVGNGVIAIHEREATTKFPRIPISIRRLDELDVPRTVSFIKIDTEGYEAAFLRGAAELIARDRPVIFGEFAAGWLARRGEDLRVELAELDYEVAALVPVRSSRWRTIDTARAHAVDLAAPGELPENLLLRPR
jgi:FkbM family methyltransferase